MFSHLFSQLPAPRPADWELNVSVCIALLTDGRKKIICITDERASFESFSGENMAFKNAPITYDWCALYAGNDVEHADPIIELARASLESAAAQKKNGRLEPREIADIFDAAYGEHLQAHIESKILRKHGFDTEEFKKSGKQKCTSEVYGKVWEKIDRTKFSLSFLLVGLSPERGAEVGHIWHVDGEAAPRCYDSVGCWAIGKGAASALSTLAFYMTHRHLTVHSESGVSAYAAITAKFMAESASDVGTSTLVTVLEPNCRDNLKFMSAAGVRRIRQEWLNKGALKIPKSSVDLINKLFYADIKEPKDIEAALANPGKYARMAKRAEAKKQLASQTSTPGQ